ncbi:24_t:CDS:10 [Entrophospora sp. SA101]|nr:24_t:CDS:10 [Entrophospora sp. SA101]
MSEKHLITQDPKKLEKLHEFAKRGGIGKGIANQDTLADTEDDLMFFTGETVTILKHIKDDYFLGYCESVIGRFKGSTVNFNGPLKDLKSLKLEQKSSNRNHNAPLSDNNNNIIRNLPDLSKSRSDFLHSDAIQNHQKPAIIIANPLKRSSNNNSLSSLRRNNTLPNLLPSSLSSSSVSSQKCQNTSPTILISSDTASYISEHNNPIPILQNKDQSIETDHHDEYYHPDASNNFNINKRDNRQNFVNSNSNNMENHHSPSPSPKLAKHETITNENNHATTAASTDEEGETLILYNRKNSFVESDQNKNVVVIPTFKIDLVPDTITKSSISEQFNIKENPKVIITSKDLKNNEIKEIVLESFKIETSIVIDESAIESSLYRQHEAKWLDILSNMNPTMARDSRKIKKLVRLGIPESLRGKAWQFMASADKFRKPGYYDELRKRPAIPIYDIIEIDIHRCYPDHIQFRKETEDLHDVLKAYAHYNPSIGYCQGMGRLAGMMLMQMPVEDSFWLLVATLEKYMVGYFTPKLTQIRINSIVFEQLLIENYPKLAQHLAENDVIPLIYVTPWFMTLFTMTLPWASVLRVWDMFYFEGVNLFYRIGLAIMECSQDYILKECPTSSEILEFLLHIPHEFLTPDLLLEAAFKIKVKNRVRKLTKKIEAMEREKDNINNLDFVNGTVDINNASVADLKNNGNNDGVGNIDGKKGCHEIIGFKKVKGLENHQLDRSLCQSPIDDNEGFNYKRSRRNTT